MKKQYKQPCMAVIALDMPTAMLLPASYGITTDEALAPVLDEFIDIDAELADPSGGEAW